MSKQHYILVDVFTDRPFGGNPLAVFPDARGIGSKTMQIIAKEFNLSETTFVLPPTEQGADYHVRIFTPAAELPMAGHPTVGTAFVMARERMLAHQQQKPTTMFLQEGVGIIAVTLDWNGLHAPRITMQQPLPTFGPRFGEQAILASVLALEPTDLRSDLPFGAVPTQAGTVALISEQGFEMGRPSLMYITVEHTDRDIDPEIERRNTLWA